MIAMFLHNLSVAIWWFLSKVCSHSHALLRWSSSRFSTTSVGYLQSTWISQSDCVSATWWIESYLHPSPLIVSIFLHVSPPSQLRAIWRTSQKPTHTKTLLHWSSVSHHLYLMPCDIFGPKGKLHFSALHLHVFLYNPCLVPSYVSDLKATQTRSDPSPLIPTCFLLFFAISERCSIVHLC